MTEPTSSEPTGLLRETDFDAIRLGRTLLREARYGALATISPDDGSPIASRVSVATDIDGTPLILISMLAAHTRALLADPRCSILLGEPGKGDPLAYPRLSIASHAKKVLPHDSDHERVTRRFLSSNSKAKLYVGLADFSIFRLNPLSASLNGGFGRAYALMRDDLVLAGPVVGQLADMEQSAVDHMNEDHREAISMYAQYFIKEDDSAWRLSGLDPEGMDLVDGDRRRRVFFKEPITDSYNLRRVLVDMAKEARMGIIL